MASSASSKHASRTLTDISEILPVDSAGAKAKRIEEFSDEVKKCLTSLKVSIKHILDCEEFPCTSCLKSMNACYKASSNRNIIQNAVSDGIGIDTDYCKMFAYTWVKGDMLRKIEDADQQKELSLDITRMFTFYDKLLGSAWGFADKSDYFCSQMDKDGCLSLTVDWFLHLVRDDKPMNKWVNDMVFVAMNLWYNACNRVPSLAPKHHRAVPAFQKFSESKDSLTQTTALTTLAKLVKKEEADMLSTNYICIVTLLSQLKGCLSNPEHKTKTRRRTSKENIVTTIIDSADELVQSVEDLTINDNNKRLVVEHGGISILAELLQRDCSVEEKTSAANVIWRLAFLKENKEKLRKEYDIIYNLSEGSRDINQKLRDACEGALFEINKTTDVESLQGASSLENEHSGHHTQQQRITEASLGSKDSASPRPSASTPVDIPRQGASSALVDISTSKARDVSDEMLNNLAKCVPAYAYDKFSEKLGIKHNQARNILTKYHNDYEEAARECLATWMDKSTRGVADLHDVLRAADLGGLIGNCN